MSIARSGGNQGAVEEDVLLRPSHQLTTNSQLARLGNADVVSARSAVYHLLLLVNSKKRQGNPAPLPLSSFDERSLSVREPKKLAPLDDVLAVCFRLRSQLE